jgi:chromosome segregation ATPase
MPDLPIQVSTELSKALEQINQKLDNLQKDVTDIKLDLATTKVELKGDIKSIDERLSGQIKTLDERLSGQIKTLDEKVTGLSKRVDSVDFINRGVFVALIVAILGGFAKIFGFIGNTNP